MTRIEIDRLRLRCTTAFSAYQGHLAAVVERSRIGQSPSAQDFHAEEQALYEYALRRREFLDALESVLRAESTRLNVKTTGHALHDKNN